MFYGIYDETTCINNISKLSKKSSFDFIEGDLNSHINTHTNDT